MSNIVIEKWFMDVVTPDGRTFIGYDAAIRWKKIPLHYSGYIFLDETGTVIRRNSFRDKTRIAFSGEKLEWETPQVKGSWSRIDRACSEQLLADGEKRLEWNNYFPKADASVQLKQQPVLQGYGYAECLHLNFPPWELPIRELRWGRFHAPGHTVAWIEWRGPVLKTIVFHNSIRQQEASVCDEAVVFDNYHLALKEHRTLRSGTLLSTVFGKFSSVKKLFPLSILRTEEQKWRCRGILTGKNGKMEEGWVICETVTWP